MWRWQCSTRVLFAWRHGALEKARSRQSEKERSAEQQSRLSSSEAFDLRDEGLRVVRAQIVGQPLDAVSRFASVLGRVLCDWAGLLLIAKFVAEMSHGACELLEILRSFVLLPVESRTCLLLHLINYFTSCCLAC